MFLSITIISSIFFQSIAFADEVKIENNKSNKEEYIDKKWFNNVTDTRLIFFPTARMLKKGSGYFQDIDIVFVNASYGVTDNISIDAMASLIPVFSITPKFGLEVSKDLSIAFMASVGSNFLTHEPILLSGYSMSTYGNADNNITLAFGTGVYDKYAFNYKGIIGGMYRIDEYTSILSENWIFLNKNGYYSFFSSLGVRLFSKGSLNIDLSLSMLHDEHFPIPIHDSFFFPIPFISFYYNF